jgi:hypothetical protein
LLPVIAARCRRRAAARRCLRLAVRRIAEHGRRAHTAASRPQAGQPDAVITAPAARHGRRRIRHLAGKARPRRAAVPVWACLVHHAHLTPPPWLRAGSGRELSVASRACSSSNLSLQVLQHVPGDDGPAVAHRYPGLPEIEAADPVDHHAGVPRTEPVQAPELLGPLHAAHSLPPARRACHAGRQHPRARRPSIGWR